MANIRRSRKSGFTLRGGVMRRESIWFGIPDTDTNLAAASTAALVVTLNAAALALRPFTVVRTRGYLHIASDQRAASEDWGAALGVAVVSDQAVAIGITAVPTPVTDRGSGLFFLYEEMIGRISVTTDVGVLEFGKGTSYDSKAMRKVESGQDIAFIIESHTTVSAAQVQTAGRMLIKLH